MVFNETQECKPETTNTQMVFNETQECKPETTNTQMVFNETQECKPETTNTQMVFNEESTAFLTFLFIYFYHKHFWSSILNLIMSILLNFY